MQQVNTINSSNIIKDATFHTIFGSFGEDDKTKVAFLMGTVGEDCIDLFNSLTLMAKLDDYFKPSKNTLISRYKFLIVTNLKNLAKDLF